MFCVLTQFNRLLFDKNFNGSKYAQEQRTLLGLNYKKTQLLIISTLAVFTYPLMLFETDYFGL